MFTKPMFYGQHLQLTEMNAIQEKIISIVYMGQCFNAVTGVPLRSNRMARFTHPEGFPDPAALFEA